MTKRRKTSAEEQVEIAEYTVERAAGSSYVLCSGSTPAERGNRLWVRTSTGIWRSPVRLFAVAFDSTRGPAAA